MRVLVDATAIPPDRGGVGRYVDHVTEGLALLGTECVVACQRRDAEAFGRLGVRVHALPEAVVRRPVRLAWEQSVLPALARRVRADVLFSPHYTTPLVTGVPRVVALHDATFFSDPEVHLASKARFFRTATRASLRLARRCVVPSSATRDELVRWTGADPERMTVVAHGVDTGTFFPPDQSAVEDLAARLGVTPGEYVAFLGTLEPRKNVGALVEGMAQANRELEQPVALVLAGAAGWDTGLEATLAAVSSRLRVVRTGYLPLPDLPALLGGAAVVAYPSLGEGFGLPVLEAMACGATVLTTRRLALPEVGGDAVAYTEPDAASVGVALRSLLQDPARRAHLAEAALRRAQTFTWTRSAQAHRQVLEEAAA